MGDWYGDAMFTYEARGISGSTATAIVTVTVVNLPDAPIAADDDAVTSEYSTVGIDALANDVDVDGDPLTILTVSGPAGIATTDGRTIDYSPTGESAGIHTLSYSVGDGTGLTDTATVRVVVNAVNLAPVLDPIGPRSVDELTALSFTVSASDADLPADTVTLSATGLPAGATFTPATGAFAWTPTEAQGPGSYDVTFTATDDGTGALSDTETITITTNEVNTAPIFTDPGDQFTVIGQAVNLPPVVVDPDDPANTLAFSATGLPAGLAIDPVTGAITGTAMSTGSGVVTITATETNGIPTDLAGGGSFNWTVASPSIVVSEIATTGAGGGTDEFIELYNPTGGAVVLDGWKVLVSDGDGNSLATIVIPGGTTVAANEYFLLAHAAASVVAPDLSYGVDMPKGAGVLLTTDLDVAVDAVGTGPAPWKDGSGSLYGEGTFLPPLDGTVDQSYERRSGVGNCIDTGDNSVDFFHNMTTRNPQGLGTFEACGSPPPFVPPPPPDHVVISEFRLDGATLGPIGGGDNEFVEIYNPTANPIDISGYRLYSQDGSLQATVPALTILPSGRHYLFASASFATIEGIVPDVVSAGGIRNGEGVYLEDASNAVVDAVSTGGTAYLEGTPLPPIIGRVIHSYERLVGAGGGNCVDTDVNSADFFHNLSSQNPQTLADPAVGCAT